MFTTISQYLFLIRPPEFAALGTTFVISSIVALLIAAMIGVIESNIPLFYRALTRKLKTLLVWYGLVSILFVFVRIELVPYLSMRIWLWVWCVSIFMLGIFVLAREYRKIPARKERYFHELKQKRYFHS